MKTRLVETVVTYVSIGLLFCFFCILFYQNFYFTESFDLLLLREMDDMAFHAVLKNMREKLLSQHWESFFTAVEYGYGNIFWSALTFLTLPAFLLNLDTLAMVLPREISLAAYTLSFFLFYKIARQLNYKKTETLLVCLFLASLGIGISTASRFHNNSIVLCLVLASVHLALKPLSKEKKLHWSMIILGLALAIKLTAIFYVPFLFLILNRDIDWTLLRQEWKLRLRTNLKYVANLILAFLIGFTPAFTMIVFGHNAWRESFSTLKYYVRRSSENMAGAEFTPLENLQYSFFSYNISYLLLGILASIMVFSVWKKGWSKRVSDLLPAYMFFLLSILLFAMSMKVKNGPIYLGFYSIPFAFLLSLAILEVQNITRHSFVAVAILCGFGIFHNYPCFIDNIDYYGRRYQSEPIQKQMQEFRNLQQLNLVQDTDRILLDMRTVFPSGSIKKSPKLAYYFQNFNGFDWENTDLFVFDPKAKDEVQKCEEQMLDKKELCNRIRAIVQGNSTYKTVYESPSLFVVRRGSL